MDTNEQKPETSQLSDQPQAETPAIAAADGKTLVDAAQLAIVLEQNLKLKQLVGHSLWLIDFLRVRVFGGSFPEKMSVGKMIKMAANIPSLVNSMTAAESRQFAHSMEVVKELGDEVQNTMINPETKELTDGNS